MLVGRAAEQRELDQLLVSARGERSAALVLRGEPGIGKSALLRYAESAATDMRVLRCVGVEAEYELPFAGMHQLVRPCLHLLDKLPAPQSAALRSALGMSDEGVDDRFLVCLGLLSLLAEACEERPVLCSVDDAQWLDAPSAEALAFVARRFVAERIAIVMTVRQGELRTFRAPGVPEWELTGLSDEDAAALLTSRLTGDASPTVLDGLLRTASGNPLALLELPAALSEQQLRGEQPILGPPPVRPAVEDAFRERVAALPARARRALVVAAADDGGDFATVRDALERLGLHESDLAAAEADALIRLSGVVEFRHPLVRSAAYRSATREDRRAAHEALAGVVADQASRAWHRALVAERADEGIAAELEAAAAQAANRGAQATASAAFERAAELSQDPSRRGHRLSRAAQAALDAGRSDAALALVERARAYVTDPLDDVALALVRASEAARRGNPGESTALMATAARTIADVAPEQAAELTLWSVMAALGGRRIEPAVAEAVRILELIDTSGPQGRFADAVVTGLAAVLAGDADRGSRSLSAAAVLGEDLTAGTFAVLPAFIGTFTGDYQASRRISERCVATARRQGALSSYVGIFPLLAICELGEGRVAGATASVAEGLEVAGRLGYHNDESGLLALQARIDAYEGREAQCRDHAEAAIRRSLAVGLGWATEYARLALADLELGLGNPRAAMEQLDQLSPGPVPPISVLSTPDIVDAALRVGEPERARGALARLEAWAPVSPLPVVRGMVARCHGVLAEDPGEAQRWFDEALEAHGVGGPAHELARTQLAYGEWLRRERRKVDARVQLRAAMDAFEGLGAKLWAERARAELDATGEKARKRDESTVDQLTPQELRIAQLVAEGASNRDVAAQLFVSPKTVEYHLRKVFQKLGVNSRVELARATIGQGSD